jgi:FKBP-type peptidyl-prolyl cis-trans isomerase
MWNEEALMRVWIVLAAATALAACSAGDTPAGADTANAAAASQPSSLAALAAANLAEAEAFLAENGARDEVTTTASGLQYEQLASGPEGGMSPAPAQWVCVHYRGTFLDGSEFDSSYSRGQAAAFPRNGVISGWVEALGLMTPGDALRLYVHPDLAYGPSGRPSIPPNAALLFDVSLIKLLDGPVERGADCAA